MTSSQCVINIVEGFVSISSSLFTVNYYYYSIIYQIYKVFFSYVKSLLKRSCEGSGEW